MIKNVSTLLSLLLVSGLWGQTGKYDKHLASVDMFTKAYNAQDYSRMQKPLDGIGKTLISKKRLRKEYAPFFNENGMLIIDTVAFSSIYNGTATFYSSLKPEKKVFMSFVFTKKGKIQGFGFGYPSMIYRKQANSSPEKYSLSKYQQIDSLVKIRTRFNGCVLVAGDNKVFYERSQGFADLDKRIPLNDSTAFLLASCSKQFTAAGIMLLREEGKLRIEDPVKHYIPEFPYEHVTIENLLTHTSGLPDYMQLIQKYADKSHFVTNEDVVKLLIDHPQKLAFTPDTRFQYCNTGYVILSLILEQVSGMRYKNFMETRIFKPLGMNRSLVYNRRARQGVMDNYALGYVSSNGKYVLPDSLPNYMYVTYMDGITGDDGISSCVTDLKTWTEAFNSGKIVSAESRNLMYTSHRLQDGSETNYGFGFMVRKGPAVEDIIFHSGSWPGYATMMVHLPEQNESIFILSNTEYEMSFLTDEIISVLLK